MENLEKLVYERTKESLKNEEIILKADLKEFLEEKEGVDLELMVNKQNLAFLALKKQENERWFTSISK